MNIRLLVFASISVFALALLQACESSSWPVENLSPTSLEHDRIRPLEENPSYWQYQGAAVLLLGASNEDNLFNHPNLPPHGLEAHSDLLASVCGSYVRNTMSSRDEGNVQAFRRLADGRYDLTSENAEYWHRFERLLEMTGSRGIVVQVELWDRFDFARESWDRNPFAPQNNVNHTQEESRLPLEIRTHPSQRENPFFRSTPGWPRALGSGASLPSPLDGEPQTGEQRQDLRRAPPRGRLRRGYA